MTVLQLIFWVSLFILFYCYVGYGFVLFILNKVKNGLYSVKPNPEFELLPVTLIVAAYNEGAVLPQKIKNCFDIEYPRHLLKLIFITDGSTDNSDEIVKQHENILLLHQLKREGKSAALKRAMRFVQTPIVVFSDANSILNTGCLQAIVPHYAKKIVGGVAGEKKILQDTDCSAVGQAEGMYWKYESFMKQQDSNFNTVVGAAGELFSLRTELFQSSDDHFILDDFMFSMQVCLKGHKIQYEPGAFATETSSTTVAEEEKRKTRIAAGAYQSVFYLLRCLNPFKYPLLSIQYFSRRFLRWVASPFLIALVLILNIEFVVNQQGTIFNYLLLLQGVFYSLALVGRVLIASGWRIGIFSIPFYFIFMNLCLVKGFFRYARGGQTVLWEKSMRQAIE